MSKRKFHTLTLKARQREKLKAPLGTLIRGNVSTCIEALKRLISSEKPTSLILVGDTITRTASIAGIKADVRIIDGKEMRRDALPFSPIASHVLHLDNEPGTIDSRAWRTIDDAIKSGDSLIYVNGEEDLLALAGTILAPPGSLVVYGQPREGVVIVKVTREKKAEVKRIIDEMGRKVTSRL